MHAAHCAEDCVALCWGIPLIPVVSRYGWQRAAVGGAKQRDVRRGAESVAFHQWRFHAEAGGGGGASHDLDGPVPPPPASAGNRH